MNQTITTIKTNALIPNPWNTNVVSPENQTKIEESVKRFGMFKPLVCRTLEDGRIEIIGGQHRWEAAVALGIEEVDIVNLGKIDDKKAKEISLVDNARYGSDDGIRLSELFHELDDIADYTPYTEADILKVFSSAEVDLDSLGTLDEEEKDLEKKVEDLTKSSPTYQVMRFKVPIGDAEFVQGIIDGIIKKQGFTSSDSLTNAGDALVFLCGKKNED